jgi:hypothetical protein
MGNICTRNYNHVIQDDDDNRNVQVKKKKRKPKEELCNRNVIIHWPISRIMISRSLSVI